MKLRANRPHLAAGVALIGVGAISMASVGLPPARDITVSARQQPETPSLTPAMVELLASVRRAMPAMETWPLVADGAAQVPQARADGLAPISALPHAERFVADGPREPAGRSGTAATGDSVTPAPEPLALPVVPVLEGLADVVDNTYNAVEAPIRRLVEAIEDGLTLIGVPAFLASQGTIFYTFGEAVVKSVLFNATDWLRGEGDFAANLEDLGTDLLAAGLWLAIDELTAFGLLPPTPVDMPRPPINQDDAQLVMSGEDTEAEAAARSSVSVDADEAEAAGDAEADTVQHDTQTAGGAGTDGPETEPVDEADPTDEPVDETDPTDEPVDETDPTDEPVDETDPTDEPVDETDLIDEPTDAEPDSNNADTDADADDKSDDADDADKDDGDDAPKGTSDDAGGSDSATD